MIFKSYLVRLAYNVYGKPVYDSFHFKDGWKFMEFISGLKTTYEFKEFDYWVYWINDDTPVLVGDIKARVREAIE